MTRIPKIFALLAFLTAAGCRDSYPSVVPPLDVLYFPIGLAVRQMPPDPTVAAKKYGWTQLVVVNSNFDLRYDESTGGSLLVVDPDQSQDWLDGGQLAVLGATRIASDPAGRILVTDTRGGQLLVFGVEPLIERQAFPVPDAPFGLTGSAELTWVSQSASNTVVGYDLSTGIPVEKVRYPTVRQPDSLAFDDASDTLYVVSGSGAGVQVIPEAGVT